MIYLNISGFKLTHDIKELIKAIFSDELVYNAPRSTWNNSTQIDLDLRDKKLYIAYEDGLNQWLKEYSLDYELPVKKQIKQLLVREFGHNLSWGILTGIRPIKIVHNLLDQSRSKDDIDRILREEYLLSEDKSSLAIEVASRNRKYLSKDDKNYSMYISIPFCPSTCLYCSFPSLGMNQYRDKMESYVETLKREIEVVSRNEGLENINTLYIGGGTPTALDKQLMDDLLKYINGIYRGRIKEFTVEAGRPDTLDYEYLKILKENGVGRISINPQTMVDKSLKIIGRNHTSGDIIEIFNLAKGLNFDSINMDLILGLPSEGREEISYTLDSLKALSPDNITVHTLAVKTGSKFKEEVDKYNIEASLVESQMKLVKDFMYAEKYIPYYLYRQKQSYGNLENIGYSRLDKECIYNVAMIEERETIIGVGMGAISKIYNKEDNIISRVPNYKSLDQYINELDVLLDRRNYIY